MIALLVDMPTYIVRGIRMLGGSGRRGIGNGAGFGQYQSCKTLCRNLQKTSRDQQSKQPRRPDGWPISSE